MFTSINARLLRSQEFQEYFDSPEEPSYFSKESMLIRQTELDRALADIGLSRKHVPTERTSLFRCLAERLYNSQLFWSSQIKSRLLRHLKELTETTDREKSECLDLLISTVTNVEESCAPDGMSTHEHIFMLLPHIADCFWVKVILYQENDPNGPPLEFHPQTNAAVDCSHGEETVRLAVNCSGYFDIVLTFEQVANRAMVQALIHEILYVDVFKYPEEEIKQTVVDMLEEKKYAKLRVERKRFARDRAHQGMPADDLPETLSVLPPISYKDAKALDLSLYRNITMDIWLQKNKDRYISMKLAELKPGEKCVVTLSSGQRKKKELGTILMKDSDHSFQVELSSGEVATIPVNEMELVSKRKERHATYCYSGNEYRTSAGQARSSPDPSPSMANLPFYVNHSQPKDGSDWSSHGGAVWYPPFSFHTGAWFNPGLQFPPPIDLISYNAAYLHHSSLSGGQYVQPHGLQFQFFQYPHMGI